MDGILLCAHCGLDAEGTQDFVPRGNEIVLESRFWVWWHRHSYGLGDMSPGSTHFTWHLPSSYMSPVSGSGSDSDFTCITRATGLTPVPFSSLVLALSVENTGHCHSCTTLSPEQEEGWLHLLSWSIIRFNS